MSNEHVIVSQEATAGTWVTPALAFPVRKATAKPGQNYEDVRRSGQGRGVAESHQGALLPSGMIEMEVFPEYLGYWLKAAGFSTITTTTPGGATNAREHGCQISNALALASLSAQFGYNGSNALNILQMTFDKMTIKLAAGKAAMMTLDWVAKDMAKAGGTWHDAAGTSSPAVIASPTYIGVTPTPYKFWQTTLNLGGTPALDGTSKQLSLSGDAQINYVENLEITVQNNTDPFPTLQPERIAYDMPAQDLDIGVKMDLDWNTITTVYYDHVLGDTQAALQASLSVGGDSIESGQDYLFEITLPYLQFKEASFPDIEGSAKRRTQSVEATARLDPTTEQYIGVTLRDTQTAY